MPRRRPDIVRVCSTTTDFSWPHGVCSTSLLGSYAAISSTPYAPCTDYSSRAPHYEAPSYHARCPYCGTARKPFTYVNCINCGAPA